MDIRRIDSVILRVHRVDRAAAFYREVLGLSQIWAMDERGGRGLWLSDKSATVTIVDRPPRRLRPGQAEVVLEVGDTNAARRELEAKGVDFEGETYDIDGIGRAAHFTDPDGNRFMLLDLTYELTRIALP